MFGTSRTFWSRPKKAVAAVSLAVVVAGGLIAGTSGTSADAAGCSRASKSAITAAQNKLNEAGFWTGKADGAAGQLTTQSIYAFQKYTGVRAAGCADSATVNAIMAFQGRAVAPSQAPRTGAAVDQTRQLLFFTNNGAVKYVLNTSTGSQVPWTEGKYSGKAVTPNGNFKVFFERDYLHQSSLGLGSMYRPKYFAGGGIAIHGSGSIPTYAASHGCVRVSNKAMDMIWNEGLLNRGTPVNVFGKPAGR